MKPKYLVRITAIGLVLASPVLIPIACIARLRPEILYFFFQRYSEIRSGSEWGADD